MEKTTGCMKNFRRTLDLETNHGFRAYRPSSRWMDEREGLLGLRDPKVRGTQDIFKNENGEEKEGEKMADHVELACKRCKAVFKISAALYKSSVVVIPQSPS